MHLSTSHTTEEYSSSPHPQPGMSSADLVALVHPHLPHADVPLEWRVGVGTVVVETPPASHQASSFNFALWEHVNTENTKGYTSEQSAVPPEPDSSTQHIDPVTRESVPSDPHLHELVHVFDMSDTHLSPSNTTTVHRPSSGTAYPHPIPDRRILADESSSPHATSHGQHPPLGVLDENDTATAPPEDAGMTGAGFCFVSVMNRTFVSPTFSVFVWRRSQSSSSSITHLIAEGFLAPLPTPHSLLLEVLAVHAHTISSALEYILADTAIFTASVMVEILATFEKYQLCGGR